MSDWQPLLQSILIGLLFSYLVAKLISVVLSFKEENLSITRSNNNNYNEPKRTKDDVVVAAPNPRGPEADSGRPHDTESMIAEQGSVRNEESLPCSDVDSDGDDDWEGVESTELDEMFSAATAFVAASAAASSQKVSNDVQLQLYALYKIATEGPCSAPQPSALKMTSRAKWYPSFICLIIFLFYKDNSSINDNWGNFFSFTVVA